MSEIHYPAGVRPLTENVRKNPSKSKKKPVFKVAPGNRGIDFETAINQSNDYYKAKGLCLITKRPTPINVVKVDYTHGPKITHAYFEAQSTTDYNGVYQGHYIDFEAKSTHSKTSFPLANIPVQQIEHLEGVLAQKGIAFFLIRFVPLKVVYLLPASYVIDFYRNRKRASIPVEDIEKNGYRIEEGYMPPYDYLPVLEEAFLK